MLVEEVERPVPAAPDEFHELHFVTGSFEALRELVAAAS